MYGVSWTHSCYHAINLDEPKQVKRWWNGEKWLENPIDVGPFSEYHQARELVRNQEFLNQKLSRKNHNYQVYNEGDPLNQRKRVSIGMPDGRSCYAETNLDNPNKIVAIYNGDKISIEEAQVSWDEQQEWSRKAASRMCDQMTANRPVFLRLNHPEENQVW